MPSIKIFLRNVASKLKFKFSKSTQKNPPPSLSDEASTVNITVVNNSSNFDRYSPPNPHSASVIVDSDSLDSCDNKITLADTSKNPSLSPLASIVPEPSEDTLEGLRQFAQFIDSAPATVSPAPESIKSSNSEVLRGSGSTCDWDDQEPFVTYKHKIIQLCHNLGLGEPSKIERMRGGSFNRVICLSLPSKDNQDYVLRIPRNLDTNESTRDQVAVLHYLAPLMPVPAVLAFDSTSDNVIGRPYILQEKLKGVNAESVYYDLPSDEKIQFVKLLADIIKKLNAFKIDRPGQLVAGPSIPSISREPLTIPTDIEVTGYRFSQHNALEVMSSQEKQPLSSLLDTIFEERKTADEDFMDLQWKSLQKITKEMKTAGLFSNTDTDCVVWHWDLAFRNIMVEKQLNGQWALTGILDWDGLLSAPSVMTRAPPVWLWIEENDRSSKWCEGLGNNDIQPARELTMEELVLKSSFEQILQRSDQNYMADAYGRGVWIRRLVKFALEGFAQSSHYIMLKVLVLEWNAYYQSLDLDTDMEDDSDEDGSDGSDDKDESDKPDDEDRSDGPDDDEKLESSSVTHRSNHSNQSSASSTYEYAQESFETYKLKVTQLCQNIGFGSPSNVERMEGGSYNRVIGLTFPGQFEDRNFILRIPRSPCEDHELHKIRDQVAILLFLKQFDFLCVPAIAAIDTTADNVIASQFVLQEKITGQPLSEVFSTLPLAEKLEVTTLVARHLTKIEDITFESPGELSGTQPLPWVSTSVHQSNSPPVISGFHLNPMEVASPLGKQGLASLLFNMLNEQKKDDVNFAHIMLLWSQLLDALKQMEQIGFFKDSDSTNILWNYDICSRHIFIEKDNSLTPTIPRSSSTSEIPQPLDLDHVSDNSTKSQANIKDEASRTPDGQNQVTSGRWKITGIIDWDDALSVPHVITRVPRTWLWFDDNERTPFWDGNRETPPQRALTEDELAIKNHFDQIMQQADPNYMNDTYFRGVWIRRLFQFTQTGFHDTVDFDRCNKFVKDWKNYFDGHVLMIPDKNVADEADCEPEEGSE
ncbi:uncharacterized protein EAE97_001422 [Botrytis byssoidea]|uniref:Aminoglycoside phosphotransferase domain-containing protein n=1 Tax=Botrytis byssoidea TaxID=139641 RepID=A0A9P5M9M8_9HELO|nr:uncharacterized protein EAE97_001422 [Botrytis byssoidea]KAF7954024.1 hypothetical protein EAE97_001422 [Botrytis byssoidea]